MPMAALEPGVLMTTTPFTRRRTPLYAAFFCGDGPVESGSERAQLYPPDHNTKPGGGTLTHQPPRYSVPGSDRALFHIVDYTPGDATLTISYRRAYECRHYFERVFEAGYTTQFELVVQLLENIGLVGRFWYVAADEIMATMHHIDHVQTYYVAPLDTHPLEQRELDAIAPDALHLQFDYLRYVLNGGRFVPLPERNAEAFTWAGFPVRMLARLYPEHWHGIQLSYIRWHRAYRIIAKAWLGHRNRRQEARRVAAAAATI